MLQACQSFFGPFSLAVGVKAAKSSFGVTCTPQAVSALLQRAHLTSFSTTTAAADDSIEIDETVVHVRFLASCSRVPVLRMLTGGAVQRLRELQQQGDHAPVFLRVEVDGGGCSGFQYKFSLDHAVKPDDKYVLTSTVAWRTPDVGTAGCRVFNKDGATLLCDTVSLQMLKGSKVEYEDSLMRSAFHVS
jgi:Fe-S cluster assembly iron-binding protein IscA